MMKKCFPLLLLVASLLAASCAKGPGNGMVRLTITAFSESTKTTLGEAIDGARTVRWVKGDAIKVFYGNGESDYTLSYASVDGPTTTFTVEIPATTRMLYALYPATTQASFSNGVISVTIPSEQEGIFSSANIAVARSSATNPGFSFKNICGYVLADITNVDIQKMTLTASGQALSGTLPVTLSESGELSFGTVSNASSTVSARVKAPGQPILALLPGVSFTDGISLEFFNADGGRISSHSIKKDFSLEQGNVLNIGTPE